MQSPDQAGGVADAPSPQALSVLEARLDPGSNAPLALGFSGGGDSLALLTLTLDWARPRGRGVLALTVDHHLQPQSGHWTARAGEQARRLGADWRGLSWTGLKPETGLAVAARRARHALLAEAAREAGASVLLLGHTADDVLEGERIRAEGTPIGGLRDWSPSPVWPEGRDVFLLRPLLGVRRAALREHLSRLGLDWIDDPANVDPRYARARVRAELQLDRHSGNPSPEGPLLESGKCAEGGAIPFPWRRVGSGDANKRERFGVIAVPRGAFTAFPAPEARALLSIAVVCAAGQERPPRGAALERLLQRLRAGELFAATLAGARLEAGPERLVLFREPGEAARGGLRPLRLEPGHPAAWDGRFEITTFEPAEVRPARGLIARLDEQDRESLRALPPAARGSAPVLIRDGDPRPVLAGRIACVDSLVERRITAACGLFAHEREIAGRTRGGGDPTSLC